MSGTVAAGWLLQMALGGGLLLLLTRLVMAGAADPAMRQRLGEVGLASALLLAALSLAPAWLPVTLPDWIAPVSPSPNQEPPGETERRAARDLPPDRSLDSDLARSANRLGPEDSREEEQPSASAPAESESLPHASRTVNGWEWVETGMTAVYAALAGVFLARWLFAHLALAWLLRGAEPAPANVTALLDEMRPRRRPRLLTSPRVRAPFSYGLVRPTMVLPASLVEAPPQVLRWVLAHEQSHLERRDGWAGLLLALGLAAFFYVPWYWWLRRQIRLCQEYVADEAAVAAGGRPEDYAEFLLGWTAAAKPPLLGIGVVGSSDLYRRIARLLQSPPTAPSRSRRCLVPAVAGLLSLAVILPGLHVQARATNCAPEGGRKLAKEEKNDQAKKTEPDAKDREARPPIVPDVAGPIDRLPSAPDEAQVEEVRSRLEAMRKRMERQIDWMRRQIERPGLRLGALMRPPEPTLSAQLDLPKGQGMVVEEVGANSTAAKAGMKPHDVLLELNGKPVPSKVEEFSTLLESIKAKTPVDAVVMRKGKKLTLAGLALPEPWGTPFLVFDAPE